MSKKSYFYIEPYVYVIIIKNSLLLYNTFTSKYLKICIHNLDLLNFITKVLKKENLRTVELLTEEIENNYIEEFINDCRSMYIGDTIQCNDKPLLFSPIPKLNNDIRKTYNEGARHLHDIKNAFRELTIFINTVKTRCLNTKLKESGYKQILFPHFFSKKNDSILDIIGFFTVAELERIGMIKIMGNIFNIKECREVFSQLKNNSIEINLYYLDFCFDDSVVFELQENSKISFIFWIDTPIDMKILFGLYDFVLKNKIFAKFKFVVTNEQDVYEINNCLNETSLENSLVPFYNQTNESFFVKYIYNTEEDILGQKLSEREIFSRMYINRLFYGQLYFLPNGEIYSNLNMNYIDKIANNNISSILKKVFTNTNEIWFKTRDSVLPCKNCIYKFICAPISNYEFAFNRMNLCTFNPCIAKPESENGCFSVNSDKEGAI